MKKALLLLVFSSLISCSENHKPVVLLGDFEFRRSYAGHENMTDAELESIEKTNPKVLYVADTLLFKKLEQFGVVENERLLIDKLVWKNAAIVNADKNGNERVTIHYDSIENAQVLEVKYPNNTAKVKLNAQHPLQYSVSEQTNIIFVLDEYYIMNGDNYHLTLFELNR